MAARIRIARRIRGAEPLDLIFLIYVGVTGLCALAFGWQLGSGLWAILVVGHAVLWGLGLWLAGVPRRGRSVRGFLRDAYPLLVIPFLYWEIRHLAPLLGGEYHDALILGLEEALFGEQLAMTFSQRWPLPWLSELMHLFYGFYWVLLPAAGFTLYLRNRLDGFRELVFVELVVFFVCYLIFIFFPVAGPFYHFPKIEGPLAEGALYGLVHWVLADGGSKGAAFPSSHVAVAVTILPIAWRHDRTLMVVMFPLVIGLTVGTVYGRFHYGIDALSGVVAAVVLVPSALALRRALGGWLGKPPDGQPATRGVRLRNGSAEGI